MEPWGTYPATKANRAEFQKEWSIIHTQGEKEKSKLVLKSVL